MKRLFFMITMILLTLGLYAQAVVDSIAVNIDNPPIMPPSGSTWYEYLVWAVGVFIVIGQVLVKIVPTMQSTHIFQVIYKALVWIYNLGHIIPDKKKGGGKH